MGTETVRMNKFLFQEVIYEASELFPKLIFIVELSH